MNKVRRFFTSVGTGAVAALSGLLLTLTAAIFAWSIFRGIPGVLIAMVLGSVTAFAIRTATTLPASPVAGAVGSMVGAFMSIATAEVLEPGSIDWVLKGGLYGATVAVPIGAVLGPLALFTQHNGQEKFEEILVSDPDVSHDGG